MNFWSSEGHQACLFGRVVTKVNKVKSEKDKLLKSVKGNSAIKGNSYFSLFTPSLFTPSLFTPSLFTPKRRGSSFSLLFKHQFLVTVFREDVEHAAKGVVVVIKMYDLVDAEQVPDLRLTTRHSCGEAA